MCFLSCSTRQTLFAQASSSHVVSCKTLMISLISALIFSKVNLLFLSASSTPAPRLLLVATKIFIARTRNKSICDNRHINHNQMNTVINIYCFFRKGMWLQTVSEPPQKDHNLQTYDCFIFTFIVILTTFGNYHSRAEQKHLLLWL